jgi:cytochrome bd-type quinol oxidase subunit 2
MEEPQADQTKIPEKTNPALLRLGIIAVGLVLALLLVCAGAIWLFVRSDGPIRILIAAYAFPVIICAVITINSLGITSYADRVRVGPAERRWSDGGRQCAPISGLP